MGLKLIAAALVAAALIPSVPAYAEPGVPTSTTYKLTGGGTETLSIDNGNRIMRYDTFPPSKIGAEMRAAQRANHERFVSMVRRTFIEQVCDIPKSRHAILTWNYTAINRVFDDQRQMIVEVFATRDDCLKQGGR